MPVWTDAFLGDTTHLTNAEAGSYMLLLIVAWRSPSCDLPDDDVQLARIARCSLKVWRASMRPVLSQFFTIVDRRWAQKRQQSERAKVEQTSAKRSQLASDRWERINDLAARRASRREGLNPLSPDTLRDDKPLENNDTANTKADAGQMPGICTLSLIESSLRSDSISPHTDPPQNSRSKKPTPKGNADPPEPAAEKPPPTGSDVALIDADLTRAMDETKLLDQAVAAWNRHAGNPGLQRIDRLNPQRRAKLRRVLAVDWKNDIAAWEQFAKVVSEHPWWSGGGERQYRATIDWAIKAGVRDRYAEGEFTVQAGAGGARTGSVLAALDMLDRATRTTNGGTHGHGHGASSREPGRLSQGDWPPDDYQGWDEQDQYG